MLIIPYILICIIFLAMDGPYLSSQGFHLMLLRRGIQSVSELTRQPGTSEELQDFFSRILKIRSFAIDEIGLKDTDNYTEYVQTKRKYLADVVSAVKTDSLGRYQRWYPLVGSVFYRGYFERREAERFAANLRNRGYDVIIRKVRAYSSLGYMTDPLYTFMLDYDAHALAELIIHEMVHATIWVPGRAEFNEEIAVFIGREGALRYVQQHEGYTDKQIETVLAGRQDYEALQNFMREVYHELSEGYAGLSTTEERLEYKENVLSRARDRFSRDYDRIFLTGRFRPLADRQWDHALVDLYIKYGTDLSPYYRLLDRKDGDLKKVVEEMRQPDFPGNL